MNQPSVEPALLPRLEKLLSDASEEFGIGDCYDNAHEEALRLVRAALSATEAARDEGLDGLRGPAGTEFGVSFVAFGPEAGWHAHALIGAMSNHEFIGPFETSAEAIAALRARLSTETARGDTP